MPLAWLLLGCGGDPLDRLAEGERGRVTAVYAGGRLQLEDGLTVRLAGLDVPGAGEPGWAAAEALLRREVEGRRVALLYGGPRRDGFGRAVAHLRTTAGRRWLQGRMLDAGLARVRTTPDDRALAKEMLEREARARAAGRGLWAGPDWRVRLPGEVAPGFVLVEGRVSEVERRGGGSRLRFEPDGLIVPIRDRAAADLAAAGTPLRSLDGRLLRIRGAARRAAGGHVLPVDHPEQIEALTTD